MDDETELEARLYGQVQHETACEQSNVEKNNRNQSEDSGVVLGDESHGNRMRYWNKGKKPNRPKKNINPFAEFFPNSRKNPREVPSSSSEKVIQPFRPYVSCLHEREVIPLASGDNLGQKGSSITGKCNDKHVKKINAKQNHENLIPMYSENRNRKLAKYAKYESKKRKASAARAKCRAGKLSPNETIDLDVSDENDDVLVVPVPAPPLVVITSSDESEDENRSSKRARIQQEKDMDDETNVSRATSLDDFIGQSDQTRILNVENIIDDEDLVVLQNETADIDPNVTPAASEKNIEGRNSPNFVHPTEKNQGKPDYNVTQSNFRAADVYESESSDVFDCDRENQSSLATRQSAIQEASAKLRTKKLRKRAKSGGSGEERVSTKKSFSYISKGVAIESCKSVINPRPAAADCNTSDNEFIKILKSISKPQNTVVDNSSESSDSEEITARQIAEDVLNRRKSSQDHGEDDDDAVPIETSLEIDHILDDINKLAPISSQQDTLNDSQVVDEYTGDVEEHVSFIDLIEKRKSGVEIVPDNGLFTVTSFGNHISWTEEMKRFYNMSWGQRHFNVYNEKKTMNKFDNWTIRKDDRYFNSRRFSKQKCYNCLEFGHTRARCPRPRKALICYMCGESGHLEPRCPNTICLRCGNKTNVFTKSCNICSQENQLICPICKIRGHSTNLCPDKWRRYHSTTEPNEYPNKVVCENPVKSCCICAHTGHYPEHCRSALRFSEYPASTSAVRSYAKSYDDVLLKFPNGRHLIDFSLVSKPSEGATFKFPYELSTKMFYGRFLKAVGLDHMITWNQDKVKSSKRKSSQSENDSQQKTYVFNPFAEKKNADKTVAEDSTNISTNEEDRMEDIPSKIAHEDENNESISKDATDPQNVQESTSHEISEDLDKSVERDVGLPSYNIFNHCSNKLQSTPKEKIQSKPVEFAPEYIPLDNDSDASSILDGDSPLLLRPIEIEDVDSEAKLYLTNFHSKYLLSPEGTEYLREISKRFDVKTRIECSSAGNCLIIVGKPNNQDDFHTDLQKTFRTLSDQSNRMWRDKTQQLPKKRYTLIHFLQSDILQLEKNLGNVEEIYKRLEVANKQISKGSWKTAEKARKTLNMILFGQAGLDDGWKHLNSLIDYVKKLRADDTMEYVPEHIRMEIREHWRHIFFSQDHENYENLIQRYLEMKQNHTLPKLELNKVVLDGKVLDISFTEAQCRNLGVSQSAAPVAPIAPAAPIAPVTEAAVEEEPCPVPPPVISITNSQKYAHNNYKPRSLSWNQQQRPQRKYARYSNDNYTPRSYKTQRPYPNWNLETQRNNTFAETDSTFDFGDSSKSRQPSIFWSRECMKYVDDCLKIKPISPDVLSKLLRVQRKANHHQLCYNDFKGILRIYQVLNDKDF